MKTQKATPSQVRQHNLQLILRAIHTGKADNRAALAVETGLTKPTVSDLITELMADGLLIETGQGKSTETGGKPPRLLEFVPNARQVIGISIAEHGINGLLTDLNGRIVAEHILRYDETPSALDFADVTGVINGLLAQLDSPLLCLGVGVPGQVDEIQHLVEFPAPLGWEAIPLQTWLQDTYHIPVYVENNTELSAIAQFAFTAASTTSSLATILINSTVEIGYVLGDTDYYSGRHIGWLRMSPDGKSLEEMIGWQAIKARARTLKDQYPDSVLANERIRFLDIRYGNANEDAGAQCLHAEIEDVLAQIFAWVITLLRPDHLALAGGMADLGIPLLEQVRLKTARLIPHRFIENVRFSLATDTNLSAHGAIALALQKDLGLIQWHNA
jgi:predicted NBD/HSP70 family sugar kinase